MNNFDIHRKDIEIDSLCAKLKHAEHLIKELEESVLLLTVRNTSLRTENYFLKEKIKSLGGTL